MVSENWGLPESDKHRLGTLKRAFYVIDVIRSEPNKVWTIAELHRAISERIGRCMAPRTVQRYVHVLQEMAMVDLEHPTPREPLKIRWLGFPPPITS